MPQPSYSYSFIGVKSHSSKIIHMTNEDRRIVPFFNTYIVGGPSGKELPRIFPYLRSNPVFSHPQHPPSDVFPTQLAQQNHTLQQNKGFSYNGLESWFHFHSICDWLFCDIPLLSQDRYIAKFRFDGEKLHVMNWYWHTPSWYRRFKSPKMHQHKKWSWTQLKILWVNIVEMEFKYHKILEQFVISNSSLFLKILPVKMVQRLKIIEWNDS